MFSKNILLVALLYISFGLVSAFNFKNIIFGGESEHVETKDSASFGRDLPLTTRSTRPDDVNCGGYLCEGTNECVDKPINCPCRLSTDKKCYIGEWYTCIRGDQSCEQLQTK